MSDARDVFERIYITAHWEGGSGQGSRSDVTAVYRSVVERLISSPDVRSVVDAGCGDWEFARLIDWTSVTYTGVDVVPAVVERNVDDFGSANVSFVCKNLCSERLPPADLLICKDVLQHWPIEWIEHFLNSALDGYRYLLLTNDVSSVHCPPASLNSQISLGAWRTIDLERPPFGVRPRWRLDYDVRGEWTKRILLVVPRRHILWARISSDSALNKVRSAFPTPPPEEP